MQDLKIVDGIPRRLTMRVTIQGGPKPNTVQIEKALKAWFEKMGHKVHRVAVTSENVPIRQAYRSSK